MTQAFDGIRIIDFTQVLAGPFGVMQLALLGAEVIKIEQPVTGDQTRGLMNESDSAGMSPSFLTCNVNKKSLTLDLKAPQARTILTALIKTADVIVENFKSGTMDRMGFGYEDAKAINPAIIYCSVTGYGQTGPKAGAAAYDGAIQAASGMMSQTGYAETGPTRTGYMPVDMATALNTAFAISAALYRRAATGAGQRLDVAMMDTAIVAQAAQFSNYLNGGRLVGLNGNASPTGQPTADVFPTRDGFIQVTALRQPQVETLFEIIGEQNALADASFATPAARMAHPEEVKALVSEALSKNSTAFWLDRLTKAGVPVAEVRTLPEVVADPQLDYRGVLEKIPSPVRAGETITIVKAGYLTDADGPSVRFAPPRLGEHTSEILMSLGFTESTIAEWCEAGVIQTAP